MAQNEVQPIIVCAREEEAEAEELARMLPVRPYILSGVPLRAACAVLERCDLFVGNDSGTAHLAAAVDCRTIVVSRHPRGGDPDHRQQPGQVCARAAHAIGWSSQSRGRGIAELPAVQQSHIASSW